MKYNVQVPNYLPANLHVELAGTQDNKGVHAMLEEEGMGGMAQDFFKRVLEEMDKDPSTWTMGEGFWREYSDGTKHLVCLGVLSYEKVFFTRLMRVKDVGPDQLKETREALGRMLREYLEELLAQMQLYPKLPPGSGKSQGPWNSTV